MYSLDRIKECYYQLMQMRAEKQKMSNREYSFDELKEEIDSGVLVKKEIYF